jgi:thymidylate synthase
MWLELIKDLLNAPSGPSRDGAMRGEILGWSGQLSAQGQRTFLTNPERGLSPSYAAAETLWYMSGQKKSEMLERYAPSYKKFAPDGQAHGAYGPRVMTQLKYIINTLRRQPHSRQAVVNIWTPEDLRLATLENTVPDLPCTIAWQFLVRNGTLHMSVAMRSNDAWKGFPYDVFAFTCFQRVIAHELGIRVGPYQHHVIGSMHLYERDAKRAQRASECPIMMPFCGHTWLDDTGLIDCFQAIKLERSIREGHHITESDTNSLGSMTRDLLAACAMKLDLEWLAYLQPRSPLWQRNREKINFPTSSSETET